MTNICAWPDCTNEADFPAPKNPQDLSQRQYFCALHIKEFNKSWNGLKGMSADDIMSMQIKSTWERPTWKMGTQGISARASKFEFQKADDLHQFFKKRKEQESLGGNHSHQNNADGTLPPDVKESCAIFSLEPPFSPSKLKKTYLSLVKKHHPDLNQGDKKAEDHAKKINVAYKILQDFSQKEQEVT